MSGGCVMSSPCASCTSATPNKGDTWELNVDRVNNRTLFFKASDPSGCPAYKVWSSLDNLYYIVNGHDYGSFGLDQDMSFLKKEWANSSVSFSGDNSASFIVSNNENLVGDTLASTAVLSFKFTLVSAGDYLCFGISNILNLNTFVLEGKNFYASSGTGVCVEAISGGSFVGLTTGICTCLPACLPACIVILLVHHVLLQTATLHVLPVILDITCNLRHKVRLVSLPVRMVIGKMIIITYAHHVIPLVRYALD